MVIIDELIAEIRVIVAGVLAELKCQGFACAMSLGEDETSDRIGLNTSCLKF